MGDKVIITIISGGVSLIVSLIFFSYEKIRSKRSKKKILKTNFIILIKHIQDLVFYLEKIIKERTILDEYLLQEININQILIDYNNIYKNDNEVIKGLLEFNNIRNKIRKYFVDNIKMPDYIDRELSITKENNSLNLDHIKFIENSYKDLEDIFIENQLQNKLQKYEKKFIFKPLQEVKKNRIQMLSDRIEILNNEVKRIVDENDVNIENPMIPEDKQLKWELGRISSDYGMQRNFDLDSQTKEFDSLKEVHNTIIDYHEKINYLAMKKRHTKMELE